MKFNVGDNVIIKRGVLKGQTATIMEVCDPYIYVPDYIERMSESKEYIYSVANSSRPNGIKFSESALELSNEPSNQNMVFIESVYNSDKQTYVEGIINRMIHSEMYTEGVDPMDYAYLQEMAGRIPGNIKVDKKGKRILIVAVGDRENRGEPHFHVYRNAKDWQNWRNSACLLFKYNRYFDHGYHRETLDDDELTALVYYLRTKPEKGLLGETYWQYLISLWNMNQPNFKLDLNLPMPDYDYDTIKRYKE